MRFIETASAPSFARLRSRYVRLALAGLAASLAVGCGNANFVRNDGVPTYKRLPPGYEIKVVDTTADLPQPNAVVGTLKVSFSSADEQRDKAAAIFKQHAPHYGCDAVSGMTVKAETRSQTAGVQNKKDAKPIVTTVFHWQGQCVRTAEAPGGLGAIGPATVVQPTPANGGVTQPLTNPVPVGTEAPADAPKPIGGRAQELWGRLGVYAPAYLQKWREPLSKPATSHVEVIEVLVELMVQVTGPTGFWRNTVPNQWMGCQSDPKAEGCVKLAKAKKDLDAWDRMFQQMGQLTAATAGPWLNANHGRVLEYLDTMVPETPSSTAMMQTKFFEKHLK